ncbi:Electron transfer flavoprotein alpha subunit [Paracholeplasma brassicae]|uniref:Electron transfer flavoprotein alpha subunit n=1 Tax=Acholeplasma brassicae TaxID=61635 RepID=U4KRE5_9MOLU|nr:electron transfer flavoprotein subunit alpha/FixB family protein [Paracholeplasma brassicae]CCV65678.1 Electron transfer flavoprotein alpha subunit [Paracholeplasma brassicae]
MSHKVAIWIEQENNDILPIGLELISETRAQVQDSTHITAIYLGTELNIEDKNKLRKCGANEIVFIKHERLSKYNTQDYTKAICDYMQTRPDVFLIGSTLNGRDLAPRISARLKTGLTADATMLEFENQIDKLLLLATRPALGGNLFATIICQNHVPQMATIRPNIFAIRETEVQVCNNHEYVPMLEVSNDVELLETEILEDKHVDLNKANVVVAGGRGVSTMFSELKRLSNQIGAEVAASRAVVDVNILPKDRLVGQTGTTVRPKVYLAFGISGAIQHIAGMDKSELVIAVNTDPKALIFDIADISIVADAKIVLPLLIKELEILQ